MNFIKTERYDATAHIVMARDKANALNLTMVEELSLALKHAQEDDSVRAIVLGSDRPRFFSSGFDAKEVFLYDRQEMHAFWLAYNETLSRLFEMPKPTVAAVSGHAYAGGALLCMACDVRLFAEAECGFAISGINIGIALPKSVMQIAIHAMGIHRAKHLFLTGTTIPPSQALDTGLAHELHPAQDIPSIALDRAAALTKKAPKAYGRIKANYRNWDAPEVPGPQEMETFLDQWFSEESMAYRNRLLQSLKS